MSDFFARIVSTDSTESATVTIFMPPAGLGTHAPAGGGWPPPPPLLLPNPPPPPSPPASAAPLAPALLSPLSLTAPTFQVKPLLPPPLVPTRTRKGPPIRPAPLRTTTVTLSSG